MAVSFHTGRYRPPAGIKPGRQEAKRMADVLVVGAGPTLGG